MYSAKVIEDSIAENGCRLTTVECTFPRIVLAEWNTHRVFSRNTASSRAIPVKKLIKAIKENPFIPERFPKNQAGMQNSVWLTGYKEKFAKKAWLTARTLALWSATLLDKIGVHKQIGNRLLEPFMWVTSVTSSTEWNNFFSLRVNVGLADACGTWDEYKELNDIEPFPAQIEIQHVTFLLRKAYTSSVPKLVRMGEWHLPYVKQEERDKYGEEARDISTGRSGKVSYLTHGENDTPEKDIALSRDKMIGNRHFSPPEHPATPLETADFCGNFRGWKQYRKFIEGESGE